MAFSEGYAGTSGGGWTRPGLCLEAFRLGRVLAMPAPREAEAHGLAALERAEARGGTLGPYTLQAAIAACHARARTPGETDWARIAALYDALTADPSLRGYHLLPSVRGDLLAKLGRHADARAEFERAAALTRNERERALLLDRAAACARA